MIKKLILTIGLILGSLLQTSPIPLNALELNSSGLMQVTIPLGVKPIPPIWLIDLDGDGVAEFLDLNGDRLSLLSAGFLVWQSPQEWQVIQAAVSDLNHDEIPEIALLLWRPFRPWPVDLWLPNGGRIAGFHDAQGQSCHMILIGWSGGRYHELWAGSALADPIISFAVADLNQDNKQELVTLENHYSDQRLSSAHKLKVWEWNGFGFSIVSSLDGIFNKMALVQTIEGHTLIIIP